MSHIHLPDGFLPVWLWLAGYALTGLLITLIFIFRRREHETRRFALLGIFAALMLLVMSIELPPIPYHATLSVVTGIVLGPPLAILAAFVVNLILAFAGHGGITVAGLNTLPMVVEILAGYGLFVALRAVRIPVFSAGIPSVMLALALGTATSFGIIALGAPGINHQLAVTAHESVGMHQEHHAGHHHEDLLEGAAKSGRLDLRRLAVIMFGVGVVGWVLEGILSAAILNMLRRTFPSLLPGRRQVAAEEMAE